MPYQCTSIVAIAMFTCGQVGRAPRVCQRDWQPGHDRGSDQLLCAQSLTFLGLPDVLRRLARRGRRSSR